MLPKTAPKERVLPLNNPVSQRKVDHQDEISPVVVKRDEGVPQGGEGKMIVIYMLLRCRQCGKEQQITFRYWTPPKWHRCVGCKELQPTQGFALIAHANYPLG